MGTTKGIGKNDDIDSGKEVEDVAHVPEEIEVETSEEKSDAQRVADGEIGLPSNEDEIFITPDSEFNRREEEEEEESSEEETVEEEEETSEEADEEKKEEQEEEVKKKTKPAKKKKSASPTIILRQP